VLYNHQDAVEQSQVFHPCYFHFFPFSLTRHPLMRIALRSGVQEPLSLLLGERALSFLERPVRSLLMCHTTCVHVIMLVAHPLVGELVYLRCWDRGVRNVVVFLECPDTCINTFARRKLHYVLLLLLQSRMRAGINLRKITSLTE